jgi:3-oxoacyl-[acyl-carrier-protein] synthase-3
MYNAEVIGTGSYVPENIVRNADLAKFVDTSDEWISERTGIKERRISTKENTTDLAVLAAGRALADAGLSGEEIDLIIVATVTPDYLFPSTACQVQARIGAHRATAFDINAACSGFIFGLTIAAQFIRTGVSQTALVIGAEVLSKVVNWDDRNTCVLFADGAGAAVVKRGDQGIISELIASDGSGADKLICSSVPLKNKFCDFTKDRIEFIAMNGREVFKFAARVMPECIEKILESSGYTLDQIRHIVPHQANIRILEAAAKKLQIETERFYVNIHKYGNTSSASIALALDEMAGNGLLRPGDLIILVGFGAGLTYGALLLKWTKGKTKHREENQCL